MTDLPAIATGRVRAEKPGELGSEYRRSRKPKLAVALAQLAALAVEDDADELVTPLATVELHQDAPAIAFVVDEAKQVVPMLGDEPHVDPVGRHLVEQAAVRLRIDAPEWWAGDAGRELVAEEMEDPEDRDGVHVGRSRPRSAGSFSIRAAMQRWRSISCGQLRL